MAYEISDWVLQNISMVLEKPIGIVFQFHSYRELKREMEADCEEIIYKEASKKKWIGIKKESDQTLLFFASTP